MTKKPNALSAILSMKCPQCRTGNMFINKSLFPMSDMMKMPEKCPHCGQKMEIEPGFYYGTGYVSYGLSIAALVFNAVWFALFVGFSWKDNSFFWYLGISTVMLLLLQPWFMRMARVLYLGMFVKYDPNHSVLEPAEVNILKEGYYS